MAAGMEAPGHYQPPCSLPPPLRPPLQHHHLFLSRTCLLQALPTLTISPPLLLHPQRQRISGPPLYLPLLLLAWGGTAAQQRLFQLQRLLVNTAMAMEPVAHVTAALAAEEGGVMAHPPTLEGEKKRWEAHPSFMTELLSRPP